MTTTTHAQWDPRTWRRVPGGIAWKRPPRQPQMMTYPFPIRRDGQTYWARAILPDDLTQAEADRIKVYLLALAMPEDRP